MSHLVYLLANTLPTICHGDRDPQVGIYNDITQFQGRRRHSCITSCIHPELQDKLLLLNVNCGLLQKPSLNKYSGCDYQSQGLLVVRLSPGTCLHLSARPQHAIQKRVLSNGLIQSLVQVLFIMPVGPVYVVKLLFCYVRCVLYIQNHVSRCVSIPRRCLRATPPT